MSDGKGGQGRGGFIPPPRNPSSMGHMAAGRGDPGLTQRGLPPSSLSTTGGGRYYRNPQTGFFERMPSDPLMSHPSGDPQESPQDGRPLISQRSTSAAQLSAGDTSGRPLNSSRRDFIPERTHGLTHPTSEIVPPPRKDSVNQPSSQGRRRPPLEVQTSDAPSSEGRRAEAQPWEFSTSTSNRYTPPHPNSSSSQSLSRQDYRPQQPHMGGMSSAPVLTRSRQDLSPYDDMIQNLDAMVSSSSRKGSSSMPASQPQSQRSPLDFGSLEASLDSMIKSNDSVGVGGTTAARDWNNGPLHSPLSDINGQNSRPQQASGWHEDQLRGAGGSEVFSVFLSHSLKFIIK
jgi:hypothetical protein